MSQILKKSLLDFTLRVAGIGLNFLFMYLATREFGIDAWGRFAIAFSVIQISAGIALLGSNTLVTKLVAQGVANFSKLYSFFLKRSVAIGLSIGVITYFILDFFTEDIYLANTILIGQLVVIPSAVINLNSGVLRGRKKVVSRNLTDTMGKFAIANTIFIPLLQFYEEASISLIVTSYVLGQWILMLVSFLLLKNTKFSAGRTHEEVPIPEALKTSASMFWTFIANKGVVWIMTIICGFFLSQEEIGAFDILNKFCMALSIILFSVNSVSLPLFASEATRRETLKKTIISSNKVLISMSLLAFGGYVFLGEFLLQIINKDLGIYYVLLLALAGGYFFNNFFGSVGAILQMTGHHDIMKYISLGSLVVSSLCLLWVAPSFGLPGVIWLYSLTIFLKNSVASYFVFRKLKILSFALK